MDTTLYIHLAWVDDPEDPPGYTRCALAYQQKLSTSDPAKVTCPRCIRLIEADANAAKTLTVESVHGWPATEREARRLLETFDIRGESAHELMKLVRRAWANGIAEGVNKPCVKAMCNR